MKKRILSILLMCCMVLTLLPTTAFALTSINVSTEEELLAALADKTIDRIGVTSDITVSRTLEIDRSVEIVVASALQLDQAQSGSDRLFHITQNGNLAVWPIYTATRDITDAVLNEGELWGNLHGEVVNDGKIIGGYFHAKVINNGEIAGGEFYGEVVNSGEIKSGTFNGAVTNQTDGLISEGKFYGDVENNGNINGGVFYGTVTGGTISDSLYKNVTFDSGDDNAVAPQRVLQGQQVQRPADPVKEGYTFIGWYDKNDLDNKYYNMPEWNFRYSVTKDMVLVAQWMEPMPISTEPITYLDKDGKQQTCTKYTVLESVTINDFFNSDDKWYDLPAGWYVVKGDVTFTPRLDTHGAVNLILTNGSHLTTEWGINVKEGDTFTVYAQSTDEDTMGRLTACLSEGPLGVEYYVWPSSGLSGIGSGGTRWRKANSGIDESEGTIIINGGYILAKGQDGASAIGGGGGDNVTWSYESDIRQCGSITINGGIVRTEALTRKETLGSAGIGSYQFGYGGSVTINGGTVMANASHDAICTGRGGSITINGGDITARGGLAGLGRGNGIGPSWIASADITINGGNIDASTNRKGAAIGGVLSTTVKITGGTIKAVGDYATVAIGSNEGRGGSVSITGGKVTAIGKGDADGIGGYADVSITGGEIDVSVEGSGVAIGGNAGGSINIQGNAIKSISSRSGACIGGSAKNITILDAELPFLGGEGILIGNEVGDNTGGDLTIRNCRILSTDIAANRGIQVGNNGNIQIENSEIMLSRAKGIRTGDGGSIAIRDSQLVTNGIYMVEGGTTQRKLKRLEITNSTVVTSDAIGSKGNFTSVGEIVIHGSSIRQSEDYGNGYSIGCGDYGSFDRIDIQDSQIDIPGANYGAAIGGGKYTTDPGNSVIRIANSRVFARTRDRWSTAIGRDIGSSGDGALRIFIENSTVTAKGGWLFGDGTEYVPGIGISYKSSLNAYIQVMDSTVESFRHTKSRNMDDSDYVYDDLHTKKLPGNPAENISICGSTVNGTRIDHSLDAYGKCTLCGKYDIGYCYKNGLLTMEGLTDCAYDGSEKKLTGLSHKTGENETKQLTENTDYTASYSNNVYPYTLNPNDAGFDPEKAPKVTLYGTGNYCGKAEHYFTISGDEQPSYTVKFDTAGGTSIGEKTGVRWEQRVLDGVEPPTRTDYEFRGWSCSGKPVFPGTTYADLAGDKNVQSITLTAQWAAAWYPEGEIKIEGEDTVWNGFESDYSARFYNTEQTVTISAPKSGGKPVEIEYLITEEDLTKARCTKRDFTPYTEPLKLNTDGQHIVYAKLTNAEGNVTYLRTTGRIVIDTTAPAINGVEDGEVYYTTKNVQITDDNLASVTVNGSPKTVGGYNTIWIALFSDANRTYKIVATDKAGNRTEKTITVYDGTYVIPVTGVSLDESSITLDVGGNQTLTATVAPEDATNKKVCWSSDNEAVATVSEDGVVTAVAGGTAVITATTHDGLFTATCTVTVNAPDAAPSITTDTLPDGKVGEAYSQTLTATGTAPITWSIDGGLPAGLSLNADTGEISGTPTADGTAKFTVKATNSAGSNTKELSITITKAPAAEYTVTVTTAGNGTASASHAKAAAGAEIALNATPDKGYHLKEWEVMSGGVTIKDDKFTMPDSNVEIKAVFEEDASPAPTEHTVTVTNDGNGTASVSPAKAAAGVEITLNAEPNTGYHLKEWQVISGNVTIKDDKFTMPHSDVEVKAIFEEDAPPAPTDPAKPSISVIGTYTYNGSEHTATVIGYDSATMDITGNTGTDAGDYTVSVTSQTGKWADDSTDAVTAAWSIGKATQEAPIGLNGVAPTEEGGSDGKITGVDATMEYRAESETIYTACTGIEIENLPAGNYFVRYAEDNNHFAGTDAEVTVGKGVPLADCTITFDGNGGSGSMDSVTVKAGTNYTLPECGFTAPDDQEFNAWEIGGTEYKVGDYYTVNGDTEIKALWENSVITPTTYTVTVNNDGNGTASANPHTAAAGTTITLTAKANRGYHFKEWQVVSPEELEITTNNKFIMPEDNVVVMAIFKKNTPTGPIGTGATTYPITVVNSKNGDVTASHKSAAKGTTVTLTVDPDKGYVLDSLTVLDGKDKERKLTDKGDGKFTFTMPADKVTVEASFKEEFPDLPNPFSDLAPSDFCYDAVMWAVGRDITGGIGNYTFGPNLPCTRAQAVTFLWRAAGSPEPETRAMPFTDVPVGSYYYNAVLWAVENGITEGTSDTMFSPDATCSRAQIVTFLWRAGGSPAASGNSAFTDVASDAYYAAAVIWAEKNDITGGIGGGLFGSNNDCTRGQIVTFLYRSVK
ncbi:MAG TPA: hypothetical protein DEW37_06345 [Oscillibacter sp.]|nr:hypothetical protein [Oscillibacter sp.]